MCLMPWVMALSISSGYPSRIKECLFITQGKRPMLRQSLRKVHHRWTTYKWNAHKRWEHRRCHWTQFSQTRLRSVCCKKEKWCQRANLAGRATLTRTRTFHYATAVLHRFCSRILCKTYEWEIRSHVGDWWTSSWWTPHFGNGRPPTWLCQVIRLSQKYAFESGKEMF